MIRMIYLVTRREGVSIQTFRNYFEGEHKELICQAAKDLNAIEFKQSLTLLVDRNFTLMVRRGTDRPYDGVIELAWENAAEIEKVFETDEAQKRVEGFFSQASEYIDLSKSKMFFTEQPRSCI